MRSARQLDRDIAEALGRRSSPRGARGAAHATKKDAAKGSDRRNIDQLAAMFDLPPWDDIDELNRENIWIPGNQAYESAIEEGESEDVAEKARERAEERAGEEIYNTWYDAVERAAEELFGKHHLELVQTGRQGTPKRRYEFKIVPKVSWRDAAEKIRQTADGVGYAYVGNDVNEFLKLGPWTPRQAVLEHLGVIADYPEVYGSHSARQIYEVAFR